LVLVALEKIMQEAILALIPYSARLHLPVAVVVVIMVELKPE
jgi:nucleotide-binding universal stress UspA family protein